mmetsp:Transcript_4816/g.9724  ORF Transcript_4816/g.9724 Transcript_4816/m.9724 type:complete len:235 (+) Transcript_4816:35-739(+)
MAFRSFASKLSGYFPMVWASDTSCSSSIVRSVPGWRGPRGLASISAETPTTGTAGDLAAAMKPNSGEKERRTVAQAVRRSISIGPRKLNFVCKLIRRKSIEDAFNQLTICQKAVRTEVRETLVSAVANGVHSLGLDKNRMIVDEAYVTKGEYKFRLHFHSKGRAGKGTKYYSHLTIRVREVSKEDWYKNWAKGSRYAHRRFRPENEKRVEVPPNLVKPWLVQSQLDINVRGHSE